VAETMINALFIGFGRTQYASGRLTRISHEENQSKSYITSFKLEKLLFLSKNI